MVSNDIVLFTFVSKNVYLLFHWLENTIGSGIHQTMQPSKFNELWLLGNC